jgi:hypothetical protein
MQSISWFALTLSLVHGVLASCRSEAPSGASTSASAGAVDSARAARTKACLDALEPQRKQADAAREKRDDVQGALKRARASLASARERGESGAEAAAIFERAIGELTKQLGPASDESKRLDEVLATARLGCERGTP